MIAPLTHVGPGPVYRDERGQIWLFDNPYAPMRLWHAPEDNKPRAQWTAEKKTHSGMREGIARGNASQPSCWARGEKSRAPANSPSALGPAYCWSGFVTAERSYDLKRKARPEGGLSAEQVMGGNRSVDGAHLSLTDL